MLETVVTKIPPPKGEAAEPLKALIFDSHWDPYRGTIVHLRVFDGELRPGDIVRLWSNGACYKVEEAGVFIIDRIPRKILRAGKSATS